MDILTFLSKGLDFFSHIFITQAKYCEVNEYILKKIIGHEIRDVTEAVYTHRSIEDLKKEIVKVEY